MRFIVYQNGHGYPDSKTFESREEAAEYVANNRGLVTSGPHKIQEVDYV